MSMANRIALVTGAARGIGKGIAMELARHGVHVAVADLALDGLTAVVSQLEAQGVRASAHAADVSRREDVLATVERITTEMGPIDILVNNAGITRDTLLMRMKDPDWDAVLDVNLGGARNGIEAVADGLCERGWGRIVNIASVVGQTGNPGQANYAASKGGLIGLTREYARRLAPNGVTVNAVAPGFIETEMTEALPDKVKAEFLRRIPLARLGETAEVADGVAWLCGAAYVTGQTLNVDGGLVMH